MIQRDPTNGNAHYYLGVIYSQFGCGLAARWQICRILPSCDKFNLHYYLLGLLALREGNAVNALHQLSRAVAVTPENVAVREAYAYVLRKARRIAQAAHQEAAILKLDPTNRFALAERLFPAGAFTSMTSGTEPTALNLFDRACARSPQGYLGLPSEYFWLSAWQEAAQVLDRGIVLTAQSGPFPSGSWPLHPHGRNAAAVRHAP